MDVVGIGTPYYDMVINVSKMPGLDGAAGANEAFYQGGGKVATAMAAAARLGRSAGMMAKVGENHRGQFIINDFRYNGVDTSAIIVDAPGTSSPFCLSLSEEEHKTRIFIGKEGTAGELLPEEIDYEYLGKAKYLHLENGSSFCQGARHCNGNGCGQLSGGDCKAASLSGCFYRLGIFLPGYVRESAL